MGINKRQQSGSATIDSSTIQTLGFNQASGAEKNIEVGRALKPLGDGAGGFTTNATTLKVLPAPGRNLAIYNNSGTMASVTVSTSNTQVSLAAGVADASGNVGIPCTPNDWTMVACNLANYVIASSANLMVFLIEDDTFIRQEASR